jgi:hypothetical protein
MSPTSYQTAPPRDSREIIGPDARGVKLILNKINDLARPLILLGLSLKRRLPGTFALLKDFYHRVAADSAEGISRHFVTAINCSFLGLPPPG